MDYMEVESAPVSANQKFTLVPFVNHRSLQP